MGVDLHTYVTKLFSSIFFTGRNLSLPGIEATAAVVRLVTLRPCTQALERDARTW